MDANNEQYQLKSFEEELHLIWFEPAEKQSADYFFTTTQIAQVLSSRANLNITETTIRKIGMALKKHGFTRISKNKTYVYPVVLKEFEAVDKENLVQTVRGTGYRFSVEFDEESVE